jgi:hypothetical protein
MCNYHIYGMIFGKIEFGKQFISLYRILTNRRNKLIKK